MGKWDKYIVKPTATNTPPPPINNSQTSPTVNRWDKYVVKQDKSLSDFVFKKLPESTVKGVIMQFNPVGAFEAGKGIGASLAESVKNIFTGKKDIPIYNQAKQILISRYGSPEKALDTAYNDPYSIVMDLSTVLGIGGASATAGGLKKVGGAMVRSSEMLNPASLSTMLTGKTVAGVSAPGYKGYQPDVVKAAQDKGLTLPASATTKSTGVRIMETIGARGLFGQKIEKIVEEAGVKLNQVADDLVKSTGKTTEPTIAGQNILDGFDRYKKVYNQYRERLYSAFEKSGGNDIKASWNNTLKTIDDIIARKQEAANPDVAGIKYFQKLRGAILDPRQKFGNIKATRSNIGSKLGNQNDPVATGNRAELKSVYASLSDDMGETLLKSGNNEIIEKYQKAESFYKEGLNKLNSPWGKLIEKNRDNPSVIAKIMTKTNIPEEQIPQLYSVIGKKNIPQVQTLILNDLIEGGKSTTNKIQTEVGLTSEMNRFGRSKLKQALTPEQYKSLNEIEKLANALGKSQRIAQGSQTAFIGRILMELTTFAFNPIAALKMTVGDAVFSKFISSSAGQQWLSKGFTAGRKTGEFIEKTAPAVNIGTLGSYQLNRFDKEK